MEGLHLFSLATLHIMWRDVKHNGEAPYHELCDMERALENEYYARTGEDIRRYGR